MQRKSLEYEEEDDDDEKDERRNKERKNSFMKIYHFALAIYDKINDVYDDVFVASKLL